MFPSRILLVLALTAFVTLHAFSAETKCNCCRIVLGDVKETLPKLTEKVETVLDVAIKNACQRYVTIQPFEEICEFIEQKLLQALFNWIEKKEGEIDPEVDCEYMRLCPRPKAFEVLLRALKVPDVPAY
ncbi:hypothetical protein COOONC_08206 [Cooperia oncophora]